MIASQSVALRKSLIGAVRCEPTPEDTGRGRPWWLDPRKELEPEPLDVPGRVSALA